MKLNILLILPVLLLGLKSQAQVVTFDSSFNGNGYKLSVQPGVDHGFFEVKKNADGSIITAGGTGANNIQLLLTKFKNNGTLDSSFGSNGLVQFGDPGTDYFTSGLEIQKDGKIVVGGYKDDMSVIVDFLARFNVNGSPDSSFGTNGIAQVYNNSTASYINDIAIQDDGKIVSCGYYEDANGDPISYVMRHKSNGTIDSSFGSNGAMETDPTQYITLNTLKVQDDNKVVCAGNQVDLVNFTASLYVLRLQANGKYDSTFNTTGIQTESNTSYFFGSAFSIAIQKDNKLIINGSVYDMNTAAAIPALFRLQSNGLFDSTFNSNGRLYTNFGIGDVNINDIAIQKDGKILSSGDNLDANSVASFFVCRHLPSGKLDSTFNNIGFINSIVPVTDHSTYAIDLQNDAKIIFAGYTLSGANAEALIGRLNNNSNDITLTSPNGGEVWQNGSSQNVTWTSNGVNNVNIEYSIDNGKSWQNIANNVAASGGTYAWTISSAASDSCWVRIIDAANNLLQDESNQLFRIVFPSSLASLPKDNLCNVFPVPANERLQIALNNTDEKYTLKLTDALGNVVLTQQIQNKAVLHTSNLAAGNYYILIQGQKNYDVKKISIQH